MPPTYAPNHDVRDSQQRLVSPRMNLSALPTLVSVGVTATKLPTNARTDRTWMIIQNQGTVPVFLGDSSVLTFGATTGYQLNPFSDITIPCNDTAIMFAIATQSCNVSILEGI